MNIPVSIELLAGILAGLIVSMVVLLLLQVRNSAMVNRIAAPAYEFVQHQAEVESEGIIDAAKENAAAILASAETEHTQVLAGYTQHAAELQATYQEHLRQHSEMLTQKMNGAIAQHVEKLEGLGDQSIASLAEGQKKLENRFTIFLESFTQTEREVEVAAKAATTAMVAKVEAAVTAVTAALSSQDAVVKDQLAVHAKAALAALDAEVAAYKKARLQIVDTHITHIVEEVTLRVLGKQLTVLEHAELAREALKEAKRNHIM